MAELKRLSLSQQGLLPLPVLAARQSGWGKAVGPVDRPAETPAPARPQTERVAVVGAELWVRYSPSQCDQGTYNYNTCVSRGNYVLAVQQLI